MPCFMLQNVFQCFFITAEKPRLGLDVVLSAGITNMVLDFLFVAVFGLGLKCAAIATVCGEIIGGLVLSCILLEEITVFYAWDGLLLMPDPFSRPVPMVPPNL